MSAVNQDRFGSERPRVLLVEDHPVMVDGMTMRLESIGMDVVGVASSTDRCLALYRETEPAFVLCDVGLGKADNGIDLARRLKASHPEARVVMYSGFTASDLVQAALDAGAVGYIRKGASKVELGELLAAVVEGQTEVFDRVTLADMVGALRRQVAPPKKDPTRLSPRELEVLELMVSGVTATRDIAAKLFVSPQTAKSHIQNILAKLDVGSRTAAVSKAYQLGLVSGVAAGAPDVPSRP